jgi:hypothetical protein
MNASLLTTPSIATFRRWLLRIHGTILTLVALGSAVATTIGWMTGAGIFGFMRQNPMVWVGLIQAYLLMTLLRYYWYLARVKRMRGNGMWLEHWRTVPL